MKSLLLFVALLTVGFANAQESKQPENENNVKLNINFKTQERSKDSNSETINYGLKGYVLSKSVRAAGSQTAPKEGTQVKLTAEQMQELVTFLKENNLTKGIKHSESVDGMKGYFYTGSIGVDGDFGRVYVTFGAEDKSDEQAKMDKLQALLASFF